jgi:hypothetical protein
VFVSWGPGCWRRMVCLPSCAQSPGGPGYLRQSSPASRKLRPPKLWHEVVQARPERPATALIPPTSNDLQPRDREHYAGNAQPLWVREGRDAQDD